MSRVLGSVIFPTRAEVAAVSGEHKNTESSSVPERPGKLRGVVRSEFRPIAGACPMPMQPLHPVWCMRAPAATSAPRRPSLISICSTCRDVGFTSKETPGGTVRPRTISAAMAKSLHPGLAEEPM